MMMMMMMMTNKAAQKELEYLLSKLSKPLMIKNNMLKLLVLILS